MWHRRATKCKPNAIRQGRFCPPPFSSLMMETFRTTDTIGLSSDASYFVLLTCATRMRLPVTRRVTFAPAHPCWSGEGLFKRGKHFALCKVVAASFRCCLCKSSRLRFSHMYALAGVHDVLSPFVSSVLLHSTTDNVGHPTVLSGCSTHALCGEAKSLQAGLRARLRPLGVGGQSLAGALPRRRAGVMIMFTLPHQESRRRRKRI